MRIFLSLCFLICSYLVHAGDIMLITVSPKSKQFAVTLPANATTGYQWSVTNYDQSFLELAESHYVVPKEKLIGAGGSMVFTFNLIEGKHHPDTTELVFTYARPWEKTNTGTVQDVTVNFK